MFSHAIWSEKYSVPCHGYYVVLAEGKVQDSDSVELTWRDVHSSVQYCPFVLYVRPSCVCVLALLVVIGY